MKNVGKIFFALFLFGIIATAFPVATQAKCSCNCDNYENFVAVAICQDGQKKESKAIGDVDDKSACEKACDNLDPKTATGSCFAVSDSTCGAGTKLSCWCKGSGGVPLKQSETTSTSDCQAACKAASRDYVSWGNTPPATGSGVGACPPGGLWTKDECLAVKNTYKGNIGEWKPPANETKGPYCFFSHAPVKLGVAIGGLTSANLAQYLAAAYRLGLGVAAILAVLMIMVGGFQYLSAAGGGGIEKAKERIKNAVIGLVLTVASYTLLQTVNPDILSLRLPRVQLIKSCNLQVDCGSRHEKTACETNATTGSRCIWNNNQSLCYDNSSNEGGIKGHLNGPCNDDGSCKQGNCILNIAGEKKCTQGGVCQVCQNDTDTDPLSTKQGQCGLDHPGGSPMKCIDNMCAIIDPGGSGKYKACASSSCNTGDDCASGFCNASHKCSQGTQGVRCDVGKDGDCNARAGYSCTEFVISPNQTNYACCTNGDPENCLGCDPTKNIDKSNSGCPVGMLCGDKEKCVNNLQ